MGECLQLELHAARATRGVQPINVMQAVVAPLGPDVHLMDRSLPCQQFRSTFNGQEAFEDLKHELSSVNHQGYL